MKDYNTSKISIDANGKRICNLDLEDYGNVDHQTQKEVTEPSYLFHLNIDLKPEALKKIKKLKVGADISLSEIEGETIKGKVEKIDGTKITAGIDLPASFIKRHHITMGDIFGY
jgi:hypothetical protein